MSHISEMTTLESGHVAVGWLHPDHPYPKSAVSGEFIARIKEFSARWGDSIRALGWGASGGFHTCEFCGEVHASGTFGVPAGDHIFYVPEMIAHYVEKHGYAPPPDFIAAVLACPLPGTQEYKADVQPFADRFSA
jgi:hypothetical protein